jgi:predicted nucleic acid-binding protein
VIGFTLDTGALIALERRRQRATAVVRLAREDGAALTVPANVVAEWWRKRTDLREAILEAVHGEPMSEELGRRVGETLAAVRGSSLVDATVIASAARRGDIVLTGDVVDFERLRARFPSVRVLGV